jgi:chitin disaccharide deacetylase
MKKIIINADDFGLKPSINEAIVESFNNGLINSTTLMANMPSFDEAVELAHKHNIINKIGIHLTLSEGQPITRNMLIRDLYNDKHNSDIKKYKRKLFFLSKKEKEIIYNEFAAQIIKVRNTGIKITHIDTHHHIDEIWSITQIILTLLKTHNIPSMRILNNLNRSTKFYKSNYRRIINKLIKLNNANYSDFFGNQLEAIWQLEQDPMLFEAKRLEIMVHPDYNRSRIIIDRIKDRELNFDYPEILRRLITLNG